MQLASHLDHVALLVRSTRMAAERVAHFGEPQEYEEFPDEGTGEIYVGHSHQTARLLLVEPVAAGPYLRALEKRGPGLHHIGLLVADVRAYVQALSGTGWYLHPKSLGTVERQSTAWLTRPGVGFLVEAHERMPPSGVTPLIKRLSLPDSVCSAAMIQALGCPSLASSAGPGAALQTPAGDTQLIDITG